MTNTYINPSLDFFNALVDAPNSIQVAKNVWPQLQQILALSPDNSWSSSTNELNLWSCALQWQYLNPQEPWAKETEKLFYIALDKHLASGRDASKSTLLRLWTKHGSVEPYAEGKKLIGTYLNRCSSATGIQTLQFVLNARHWMDKNVLDSWLEDCKTQTLSTPTPTAFSNVAYMLNLAETNPAQKRAINSILSGSSNDYPMSFVYAYVVGQIHPEPLAWACEMLDIARSIGFKRGYNEDLQAQAKRDVRYLEPMFDHLKWEHPSTPWTMFHTKALLLASEIESTGNPMGMDMDAWNARAPNAWPFVKSSMALLESMGWVEDPSSSRPTLALIERMHQFVVPFLDNIKTPQADLPLPACMF